MGKRGKTQIRGAVHAKAHTRFGMGWKWDGGECVLQSRCTDELGQVQPSRARIRRDFQGAAGPLQNSRRPGLGQHNSTVAGSRRWERAQCDLTTASGADLVRVRRCVGPIADLWRRKDADGPGDSRRGYHHQPRRKNLPPGQGTAKEGAAIFAQKCAMCHGANGSGGLASMLIKPETPLNSSMPCLEPCIRPGSVMALHAPYATVIWDYINRGMPFKQEGSLKPDEVYSLTAFLLYKTV